MKQVALPGGEGVPALGQGTWMMGEKPPHRGDEIATLRAGIELGMTLIDTAEMYGDGASEELIGEAIEGRRDDVFLVTKAYPHNASRSRLPHACEASLRRLGTDRIDLYLLHWRGSVPLAETIQAMEALRAAGKICRWGVSNLGYDDMAELVTAGGSSCAANQILYNLTRRGPEFDLLPYLQAHDIPLMAYSPVEQGRLLRHTALASVAQVCDATPAQIALAWAIQREGVIAIPKASSVAHVRDNRAAADIALSEETLATLDRVFPPPKRARALEML